LLQQGRPSLHRVASLVEEFVARIDARNGRGRRRADVIEAAIGNGRVDVQQIACAGREGAAQVMEPPWLEPPLRCFDPRRLQKFVEPGFRPRFQLYSVYRFTSVSIFPRQIDPMQEAAARKPMRESKGLTRERWPAFSDLSQTQVPKFNRIQPNRINRLPRFSPR
jgi:hypothetical protein